MSVCATTTCIFHTVRDTLNERNICVFSFLVREMAAYRSEVVRKSNAQKKQTDAPFALCLENLVHMTDVIAEH